MCVLVLGPTLTPALWFLCKSDCIQWMPQHLLFLASCSLFKDTNGLRRLFEEFGWLTLLNYSKNTNCMSVDLLSVLCVTKQLKPTQFEYLCCSQSGKRSFSSQPLRLKPCLLQFNASCKCPVWQTNLVFSSPFASCFNTHLFCTKYIFTVLNLR